MLSFAEVPQPGHTEAPPPVAWAENLTLKNLLFFRKSWIQIVKYLTQSKMLYALSVAEVPQPCHIEPPPPVVSRAKKK